MQYKGQQWLLNHLRKRRKREAVGGKDRGEAGCGKTELLKLHINRKQATCKLHFNQEIDLKHVPLQQPGLTPQLQSQEKPVQKYTNSEVCTIFTLLCVPYALMHKFVYSIH